MKKKTWKKSISLLLCAALILSLSACGKTAETPAESLPEQQETVPSASEVYTQAAAALDASDVLSIQNDITLITQAGADTYKEEFSQTLELRGRCGDALSASISERCNYGNVTEMLEEVYSGGVLYSKLNGYSYQSTLSREAFADYIFPVVLLSAELYGTVEWEDEDTIRFTDPTGPEDWLGLEEAELTGAEGFVDLDDEGRIVKSGLDASYSKGAAEIQLSITSTLQEPGAEEITAPANPEQYVSLPDPYVPQMVFRAQGLSGKSTAISFTQMETFTMLDLSYGMDNVARAQTFSYDCCGGLSDLVANMDVNVTVSSGYYGETYNTVQNEHFENGEYTYTVDGEKTQEQGISALDMRSYYQNVLTAQMPTASEFAEYTLSDLGGSYLIEYVLTDEVCDSVEDYFQYNLFSNENFLDEMGQQSSVEAGERKGEGYIGIDKATGLPTSVSISYASDYLIDGMSYSLGYEFVQAMNLGSPWIALSISETEPAPDESLPAPTPLFYHVTGENGQELWLLGTIHVGDSRTRRLPQEIYDAFAAADALAVEFDSEDFLAQLERDPELAAQVFQSYLYSDGSMGSDHAQDQELYENAVRLLKAAGQYSAYSDYMRLFLLSQTIENFYLQQGYELSAEYGVDAGLMKLAGEQGKPILNVESGQQQLQMLAAFSDELQELMLADTVYTGQAEFNRQSSELFELWCGGDEAALTTAVGRDLSTMTEEEKALYEENRALFEEYDRVVMTQRNAGMLDVAVSYLNGGQTVFYAVGLAHLLTEEGLVQALRDAGYTVELVSFA